MNRYFALVTERSQSSDRALTSHRFGVCAAGRLLFFFPLLYRQLAISLPEHQMYYGLANNQG